MTKVKLMRKKINKTNGVDLKTNCGVLCYCAPMPVESVAKEGYYYRLLEFTK